MRRTFHNSLYTESFLTLSESEKGSASILIVEPDSRQRHWMRGVLMALGYGCVHDAANHCEGLELLVKGGISHVVFDVKRTTMQATEFVRKVLEEAPHIVPIPTSARGTVDEVFEFLVLGARGYLLKPFTTDSLDYALVMATRSEPLSCDLRDVTDRNQVLALVVMDRLDKVATLLRESRRFDTAKLEIPGAMANFRRSTDIALTFARGGREGLFRAFEQVCSAHEPVPIAVVSDEILWRETEYRKPTASRRRRI